MVNEFKAANKNVNFPSQFCLESISNKCDKMYILKESKM